MKVFFLVALFLQLPNVGATQTFAEFEKHINFSLQRIQALHDSTQSQPFFDSDYFDSLRNENANLKKYLLETLPHVPESLTSATPWFGTVTSVDKHYKEWSWDTWMGGTMPIIFKVIEYRTPKSIKVFDPIDTITEGGAYSGGWGDSVYTVQSKNGSAIYLPVERYKSDTRDWGEGISAFRIKDTLERDIPLFQDTSGFISGLDWRNEPTMAPNDAPFVITVSDQGRTILIPYLDDNRWKHKLYKFNGEHFVYKGISK